MNWQLLIPLVTTTLIAISGWLIGHALNAKRDRMNKRREIRVQHLIDAYRNLEAGTCRGSIHGTPFAGPFEAAMADIQLLGSTEQAQMAKNLAIAISRQNSDASAGQLLMALRDSLRKELGLPEIHEEPFHFRLSSGSQQGAQPAAFGAG